MVKATVDYVCDWRSQDGDDQFGHIHITTPTGMVEATWSCRDGRGRGAELISNSTEEISEAQADSLLDHPDLCRGNGRYTCEIDLHNDDQGWVSPTIHNVVWIGAADLPA